MRYSGFSSFEKLYLSSKYIIPSRNSFKSNLILKKNTTRKFSNKMVEENRIVKYEDMLEFIKDSSKLIVDVRQPEEYREGNIPTSVNIPLISLEEALQKPADEFKQLFNRNKPSSNDVMVLTCRSGKRASDALVIALNLGYKNSLVYLGSWNDWASNHKFK